MERNLGRIQFGLCPELSIENKKYKCSLRGGLFRANLEWFFFGRNNYFLIIEYSYSHAKFPTNLNWWKSIYYKPFENKKHWIYLPILFDFNSTNFWRRELGIGKKLTSPWQKIIRRFLLFFGCYNHPIPTKDMKKIQHICRNRNKYSPQNIFINGRGSVHIWSIFYFKSGINRYYTKFYFLNKHLGWINN